MCPRLFNFFLFFFLFHRRVNDPRFTQFHGGLASFIIVEPVVMVADDRSRCCTLCKIITSLCAVKS